MVRSIGIIAVKGGVGKTSISASLAADLANRLGKKVLLVDAIYSAPNLGIHMDIIEPVKTIHDVLSGQADISHAIHKRYGVDVIPGSFIYRKGINHFKLKSRIGKIKDNYDFVIIGIIFMLWGAYLLFYHSAKSFGYEFLIVLLEPGGWFLFWEGLDLVIFKSKELKPNLDFYKKMARANITFSHY